MSQFPYLTSLFLCLALISACSLQPTYDAATARELAQIRVAPMAERQGQIMKIALLRAFDPQGLNISKQLELSATVQTSVVLTLPETTSYRSARGTLTLQGTLVDTSGQVLWSGIQSRSGLFVQHELPSLSAMAQEDLWQDLADLVARDLAAALAVTLHSNP